MAPPTSSSTTDTEHRLLEAAGEVFAEKGFRAATIRDIIRRARANIAAVNYHYGDKERLYAAVFRYARFCCQERYPLDIAAAGSPEERLHGVIESLLLRILDHGRPAWHWQLMAREMIEPTAALDEMVENSIKPEFTFIAGIVCEITRLPRTDWRVSLCVHSIIGQVLFYRHAHAVVSRMHPEQKFDRKDLELLADHITRFSLCALLAIAKKPSAKTNDTSRRRTKLRASRMISN
jgi:AcrR family transcriptional regulator